LAVIVLGSELRPHFSGPSYVRKGSETFAASEEQFNELIASRNSQTNKILGFKGKVVTVVNLLRTQWGDQETAGGDSTIVEDCNQFWVTLKASNAPAKSISLSRIELSFDDANHRLKIGIRT